MGAGITRTKKRNIELTLTAEYVNSNNLADVIRETMMYGTVMKLYRALGNLCVVEDDMKGLNIVNRLFKWDIYFEMNVNNGNLTIRQEEEN